ncbi:hypothetical protein GSI_09529 [Ganoderma sinense ZZ0214-1]|uniref:Uncharacterized protein n=1 Tax=Ganoderma sinense ZZ0214-1 TaxID=1077348 RepID=A0A2G8S494_9APHY|nr:hypothetical protein GSI_09529 [Ganoderma sinense ZZ0214-1]
MSHSSLPITLPPGVAVDPNFKIDIVNPRTGDVGLQVGQVVDLEFFSSMFPPRALGRYQDILRDPARWATITRMQLSVPLSELVDGLRTPRPDLTPPGGASPQALHAFIPGGPKYPELRAGVTPPAQYTDLHDLLADILACQAVWFMRTLWDRPGVVERLAAAHSIDAQIWQLWKRACGSSTDDYLKALYIVSIRRMKSGNTWAYFPEVEIRGNFQ